jgi:hypothetical protein
LATVKVAGVPAAAAVEVLPTTAPAPDPVEAGVDPQAAAENSITTAIAADRRAVMSGDTDGRRVRFSRNGRFFSGRQVNQKGGSSVSPDVTADAEFVKALHAQHGGPLFAFCVRYTGDRGRAEDVVQEVMLRAWRNLDQLELGDRSIRPWLMTCARNVLTD